MHSLGKWLGARLAYLCFHLGHKYSVYPFFIMTGMSAIILLLIFSIEYSRHDEYLKYAFGALPVLIPIGVLILNGPLWLSVPTKEKLLELKRLHFSNSDENGQDVSEI